MNNRLSKDKLTDAQLVNAQPIFLTPKQIELMCDAALGEYKKNENREVLGDLILGFFGVKNGDNADVLAFVVTNDKSWRLAKQRIKDIKMTEFGVSFATAFDHFGLRK